MYYFSDVIDEIENNLFGEIDYNDLARKTGVSLYPRSSAPAVGRQSAPGEGAGETAWERRWLPSDSA